MLSTWRNDPSLSLRFLVTGSWACEAAVASLSRLPHPIESLLWCACWRIRSLLHLPPVLAPTWQLRLVSEAALQGLEAPEAQDRRARSTGFLPEGRLEGSLHPCDSGPAEECPLPFSTQIWTEFPLDVDGLWSRLLLLTHSLEARKGFEG